MSDQTHKVVDAVDNEITVGCKVIFAGVYQATVFEITDPDADYDDELQRAVSYPPKVKIRFDDNGEEDGIPTIEHWQSPAEYIFKTDDLVVGVA